MKADGCSICCGCLPEDEWCRVCGRNEPERRQPEPPRTPLQEAIRKARGDEPTAEEIERSIHGLNCLSRALLHPQ